MRGRLAWTVFGCLMLSLLFTACGGDGGSAALPAKGVEVCDKLKDAESFRYTLNYIVDSAQQDNPPDDSTGGDYAVKPSQVGFRLNVKHSGAAQRPDRLDFEITQPDQPEHGSSRTIRIGENQWFFVIDSWQVAPPDAAFPWAPPNVCDVIVSPLELADKGADVEKLGDTNTRHIRIDGASLSAASQLFGPASDMGRLLRSYDVDLWLSERDARPVKIEVVTKAAYPYGRELSVTVVMEIGSYNDGDIAIEPPEFEPPT